MSVLTQKNEWQFKAPVTIGPNSITITGSWEAVPPFTSNEWRMSPLQTANVRLATWKQQLQGRIVEMCVDWSVYDHKTFHIYLRLYTNTTVTMHDIEIVSEKVRNIILEHNLLYSLQQLFQQAQPGEATISDCAGNAGKDGAHQSD